MHITTITMKEFPERSGWRIELKEMEKSEVIITVEVAVCADAPGFDRKCHCDVTAHGSSWLRVRHGLDTDRGSGERWLRDCVFSPQGATAADRR